MKNITYDKLREVIVKEITDNNYNSNNFPNYNIDGRKTLVSTLYQLDEIVYRLECLEKQNIKGDN
jgi:hypothetical protein